MFKKARQQSKESLGNALEKIAKSVWRGVGALLGFVAGLPEQMRKKAREDGDSA